MAFTQFKNVGEVFKKYPLKVKRTSIISKEIAKMAPQSLHEDIAFALEQALFRHSETAICEQLIYPVLRATWKEFFLKEMLLWSHTQFVVDDTLSGIPDYVFSQRTDYDSEVLTAPILLMAEAKKDNFEEGWGQCLAEMIAAQQINEQPDWAVYGIVSNGKLWEFARLKANIFTKHTTHIDILNLNQLYSAIYFMLEVCNKQLIKNS
jgi:hypothetical protein